MALDRLAALGELLVPGSAGEQHVPRGDDVDADPLGSKPRGEVPRVADERGLGGAVRERCANVGEPGYRPDQRERASRMHRRGRRLTQEDGGGEVQIEQLAPRGRVELPSGRAGAAADARHRAAQPTERLGRAPDGRRGLFGLAHVCRERMNGAIGEVGGEALGGELERLGAAGGDRNVCALLEERARRGQPDPAARARHEHGLVA